MTCDLVTNRFLELYYEECLIFPHEFTALMIYILTLENNLLPSKYIFLTSGKTRFHFLGNLIYYLIPDKLLFFTSGELHVSFSWEMTCDLVTNRFLELSYEECLLFPHKSTVLMIYILTFKDNLLPSKYLFPNSFPPPGQYQVLPYTR